MPLTDYVCMEFFIQRPPINSPQKIEHMKTVVDSSIPVPVVTVHLAGMHEEISAEDMEVRKTSGMEEAHHFYHKPLFQAESS